MIQDGVVDGDAGGHQLGDAPLHQLLGQFGILQLVANGHPLTGTYQLGQVGVERVVGKPRQLHELGGAVGAAGESDTQYLGGYDGVVGEGLIKVAHAEQQDGIGMFLLDLDILHHHRCLSYLFCHGLFLWCLKKRNYKKTGSFKAKFN